MIFIPPTVYLLSIIKVANKNLHYRFLYCYQSNRRWQEQNQTETFLKLRLQAYTSHVLIIRDVAVVVSESLLILVWLSKCRRFQILETPNILPVIDSTKQTNKFQNFDLLDPFKFKEELRIPKRILKAIKQCHTQIFDTIFLSCSSSVESESNRFGIHRLIGGTSLETHVCSVSTSSSPRYIAYLPLQFMRAETLFLWTQRCTSERHSVRVVPT